MPLLKWAPSIGPLIDYPPHANRSVLLAGTVRSGTTWASAIINHANEFRYLFEPLYPGLPFCSNVPPRVHLRKEADRPQILEQLRLIFSGRVRHRRVDQFNRRAVSTRRLIKAIHVNLMLPYVRHNFPEMPIVLLLRHPCAVVNSLLRLQWPAVLHHVTAQEELLQDLLTPFSTLLVEAKSTFEKHLLLWCVETYVPLVELGPDDVHLLFYEQLCAHPESELAGLFSYLNWRYTPQVLIEFRRPSPLSRDDSAINTGSSLTESWRQTLTGAQVSKALEILRLFGLDWIYSESPQPNVEAARQMLAQSRA